MSNLKSCPDCGHQVSPTAATCPNCGKANPGGSASDVINTFIWKFFGTLFLLFVVANMIGDYRRTNVDELGASLDRLEAESEENLERIRQATGNNN